VTPFSRLAPARRRFWVGVGSIALLAVVAVVSFQVATREPAVRPVAQDEVGPVLLVPGYGGDTTSLDVLAEGLREDGRDAVVVAPRGGGTGDLRDQAARVASVARGLVADGAPSVDLVGYSAGGVVVRLVVADEGGGSFVRRVVTLASPHHGTEVAGLASDLGSAGCPAACEQLAPDSDLLTTLNAGDETPPGPDWVALWTTDDATVVPPTSGELDGALDIELQDVCPGLVAQHADVPRTPAVIEIVQEQLGTAPPVAPTRAVCG
jgi:triacylglycerol esterase/lipase EstA (alpha/beta hydrolase family)